MKFLLVYICWQVFHMVTVGGRSRTVFDINVKQIDQSKRNIFLHFGVLDWHRSHTCQTNISKQKEHISSFCHIFSWSLFPLNPFLQLTAVKHALMKLAESLTLPGAQPEIWDLSTGTWHCMEPKVQHHDTQQCCTFLEERDHRVSRMEADRSRMTDFLRVRTVERVRLEFSLGSICTHAF